MAGELLVQRDFVHVPRLSEEASPKLPKERQLKELVTSEAFRCLVALGTKYIYDAVRDDIEGDRPVPRPNRPGTSVDLEDVIWIHDSVRGFSDNTADVERMVPLPDELGQYTELQMIPGIEGHRLKMKAIGAIVDNLTNPLADALTPNGNPTLREDLILGITQNPLEDIAVPYWVPEGNGIRVKRSRFRPQWRLDLIKQESELEFSDDPYTTETTRWPTAISWYFGHTGREGRFFSVHSVCNPGSRMPHMSPAVLSHHGKVRPYSLYYEKDEEVLRDQAAINGHIKQLTASLGAIYS